MRKILFYAMQGKKMCFLHVLMNALQLTEVGHEVRIVFEGESVKLPSVLAEEKNKLYSKANEKGLIAGICLACSAQLGVLEANKALDLPLLDDLNGHAGILPFLKEDYEVIWA
ncbi:MAG TPA: hypothetical protein GXX72_09165 [Clostridiaceae bacterium]|nr:hypothetical protein [Clostridiaceae bacterium]